MDGPSKTSPAVTTIDMVKWKTSDGTLEAAPTVEGCWSSHMFRNQPLQTWQVCPGARSALSHYTKLSQNMAKSIWSRKNAAQCAEKWQRFIDNACDDNDTPKTGQTSSQQPATRQPAIQPGAAAFWATTPFQLLGAAQQLGRDVENAAQSPYVAPTLGAAAFVGLTLAAASQLRFGNTAPLQRLIEAL